jgi:peroxiredoxin
MSERFIARTGLTAAILTMTLAMAVLGHQALTQSRPSAEIGKTAPQFTLPDTAGHTLSLADLRGRAVVLFFGSDACPVSKRYADRLASLARGYAGDDRVRFLAINSNTRADAATLASLRLAASDRIPTLLDPMADVARSFGATVTPTFCVIDSAGTLRYAGAFDSGQADPDLHEQYVLNAIEHTLDGIPVAITSTQAFGAAIRWIR